MVSRVRVPIYYFASRVFLTFCVIPESIRYHRTCQRSASVSMRVCNLQFVKLGWKKCEQEIWWKKKNTRYLSHQKQSAGRVNLVLQADMIIDSLMSDVKKKLNQNWRDALVIEHTHSVRLCFPVSCDSMPIFGFPVIISSLVPVCVWLLLTCCCFLWLRSMCL